MAKEMQEVNGNRVFMQILGDRGSRRARRRPKSGPMCGGKRAGAESRLGRRFAQGRARRSHPSWSRRAGRRPKSVPMCWRKTSWRARCFLHLATVPEFCRGVQYPFHDLADLQVPTLAAPAWIGTDALFELGMLRRPSVADVIITHLSFLGAGACLIMNSPPPPPFCLATNS